MQTFAVSAQAGGAEGGGGGGVWGGAEGDGGPQQAAAQLTESESPLFALHKRVHVTGVSPLHKLSTLVSSVVVHVSRSARALQLFSDGVGVASSARPLLISETSGTMSRVADGAAAPMQLSKLRAASRHVRYGSLSICVDHVRFG